jgi:hypothetical protein
MKATPIKSSCQSCGTQIAGVMHVLLCDGCLEARLAELEPMPGRTARAVVRRECRRPPVRGRALGCSRTGRSS